MLVAVWRDTARRVGVLGMDAWCLAPMLVWFLHWRWATFYVAMAGVAFFAALEFFGLSIVACARRVRCWIVGKARPGVQVWKRRWYA